MVGCCSKIFALLVHRLIFLLFLNFLFKIWTFFFTTLAFRFVDTIFFVFVILFSVFKDNFEFLSIFFVLRDCICRIPQLLKMVLRRTPCPCRNGDPINNYFSRLLESNPHLLELLFEMPKTMSKYLKMRMKQTKTRWRTRMRWRARTNLTRD